MMASGALALQVFLTGCTSPRPDPRPIFAAAVQAHSDRQFTAAAAGYERILRQYPQQTNLCAQALRSLGNVRAAQGRLDDAVKLYAKVAQRYPGEDWEVLQAWKSAADLLWDAHRSTEAKTYYGRIVDRFDVPDAPAITKTIVQACRKRLATESAPPVR
jgi:TolA-binding protein